MVSLSQDNPPSSTDKHLVLLRQQLSQVTSSWTMDDYRAFATFYARILPRLMNVERCTIYIMEIGSNKICSIFGTGLKEKKIEPPLEGSIVGNTIVSGKSCIENDLSENQGYHLQTDEQTGFVSRTMLCSPIKSITGNGVSGAIQLLNKNNGDLFTREDLEQLEEISSYLSRSIESIVLNQEILRIAGYLNREVDRLEQFSPKDLFIVAESEAMHKVLDLAAIVSKTPINVLLQGENGTGKELIARFIHSQGERKDKVFVPVNCACIPEHLAESEFFGHEKGAFTGADSGRTGRFEEASDGTLFLDEIAEMPMPIQPKFLRAIQEGEGSRLGNNKLHHYNLRLISATNKDLNQQVKEGSFRQDFFFRLFSVDIYIPPLRERQEDILPLALYFLAETNKRFKKNVPGFSRELLELFEQYSWPGNVRQLLKEVERLVALTPDLETIVPETCSRELLESITLVEAQTGVDQEDGLKIPAQVRRLETRLIKKAMAQTGGNKSKAAGLLGITRQGLLKKIKRYEINLG